MELQGDDEITLLCAVINEMSVQLREKEEREKRQQQSKNELITNVSHDLRRPGQKRPPKLRAGACHCKTHRGTPRGQGQCIVTGTGTVRPSVSQIKEKSPLEKICMYCGEKGTLFLNKKQYAHIAENVSMRERQEIIKNEVDMTDLKYPVENCTYNGKEQHLCCKGDIMVGGACL